MTSLAWYVLAALSEISGCFAFWAWLRMHKNALWIIPGVGALIVFALALTRIDTAHAGRGYAAYGGIYILASIFWLWRVEGVAPDRWDMIGAGISLAGAGVILFVPRS
jgi:small multidrug resistance family-3 protein